MLALGRKAIRVIMLRFIGELTQLLLDFIAVKLGKIKTNRRATCVNKDLWRLCFRVECDWTNYDHSINNAVNLNWEIK